MAPKDDNPSLRREIRSKIGESFLRLRRELSECASQLDGSLRPLVGDDEVDRQGKKTIRLALQIGDARLDRRIYDQIVVDLVGNRLVVAFEQVLMTQ